jgi:dihydroorotase
MFQMADAYKGRIMAALPADTKFTPLMTLYLTKETTPEVIRDAAKKGEFPIKRV